MKLHQEYQQSEYEDAGIVTGVVRIVDIEGAVALVEPESKSGCQNCAMAKGCGTKMLAGYFSRNMKPIRIQNDFGGKVGDRIEVGMENATILKLSAITYLLPLVSMACATIIAGTMQLDNSDVLIFTLLGLVGGFVLARKLYESTYIARTIEFIFLGKLPTYLEASPAGSKHDGACHEG